MSTVIVEPAEGHIRTRWDDVLDWSGSVRAVAVMRIAIGPITLLHLRPFLRDAAAGVSYDDHFWRPFVPWLPELPAGVWFALLWVGAMAAVLMTIGLWTRFATVTAFAVVAGNLLLSQTHFRHNRTFLVILLGGLALLPAGRLLSVDAWRRGRAGNGTPPDVALLWPVWLLRVQVCLVYLASGISKLVDPDWLSGLVLWDRVVRYQHELAPLPEWARDLLLERWLFYAIGPAAVLTELFIGVGLWFPRTRLVALWVALSFHVMIEISVSVEVFSYAAIAALAIWVTPSTRDRVVRIRRDAPTDQIVLALVRVGDWFGRFRTEPAPPAASRLTVVDRDGTEYTGGAAVGVVLSRLPLTFAVGAPIVAVTRRRRARRRLRSEHVRADQRERRDADGEAVPAEHIEVTTVQVGDERRHGGSSRDGGHGDAQRRHRQSVGVDDGRAVPDGGEDGGGAQGHQPEQEAELHRGDEP